MLFSALHIGSQIDQVCHQDSSGPALGPSFLTRAAQALVTGRYQKARPYSVEAVLLYGVSKYMQREDPDTDPDKEAWIMMGIGARLAMRMGYHRDPRHLAKISPFEGEMRRRTFWMIEAFDILLSSQAGLPAIIHEDECDTEPPSNLFDSDFDEDCKALPHSRPLTDPTPMLYPCCKGRIMRVFRRVIRYALSPKTAPYEDVMKLDGELHARYAEVPASLRIKSLSLSITDQAPVILNRLHIELLYLKSLCMLHRNYLSHERSNPTFDYSRKTCTEAALQILSCQAELHAALQPEGKFCNNKYMLSSLALHDFLLGAMITCLDLYESYNRSTALSREALEAQAKKYDALKYAHSIWMSRRAFSRDARRASNVLAVVLLKVPRPDIPCSPGSLSQHAPSTSHMSVNGANGMETAPSSSGIFSWNMDGINTPGQELDTIFNDMDYIDWVSYESLQPPLPSALLIDIGIGTFRSSLLWSE